MKILIIDDDEKLCRLVREYLEPMGFEVQAAHKGPEGLQRALEGSFSAILLDVMLPGMDGFEVLRQLREKSKVPILMFTARGNETDRIVGLEMGADDYLPKTFSSRELLARLRAVTRRTAAAREENKTVDIKGENDFQIIDDLEINPAARTVTRGNENLNLTAIEFDLLTSLVKNRGRILSRDRLLDLVSGRDYNVFDRSIDVHISSLRRKLQDNPKEPRYIKTVRSSGYMFVPGQED
ncbi:MAG: response regulator transcription factor [Deltaproteobacteria bacterium]|nr:response regulator transcription factor [Deltaproteobacteria bacterium]